MDLPALPNFLPTWVGILVWFGWEKKKKKKTSYFHLFHFYSIKIYSIPVPFHSIPFLTGSRIHSSQEIFLTGCPLGSLTLTLGFLDWLEGRVCTLTGRGCAPNHALLPSCIGPTCQPNSMATTHLSLPGQLNMTVCLPVPAACACQPPVCAVFHCLHILSWPSGT